MHREEPASAVEVDASAATAAAGDRACLGQANTPEAPAGAGYIAAALRQSSTAETAALHGYPAGTLSMLQQSINPLLCACTDVWPFELTQAAEAKSE